LIKKKKKIPDPFETSFVNSIASTELKSDAKISNFSSLLDSSQILEEEQVVVAKKPPINKKKSLHAYSDAPKPELKQLPKGFTVEVPSKLSVVQDGETIKFFERHKMKRKTLHDIRLSRKLLNSSKGVDLHVSNMKSTRGSNYSFGGFY
jgi:hypothetical protein